MDIVKKRVIFWERLRPDKPETLLYAFVVLAGLAVSLSAAGLPPWLGRLLFYTSIGSLIGFLFWQLASEKVQAGTPLHPYRRLWASAWFWGALAAGCGFTVWHAGAERFIYFWDTVGYWQASIRFWQELWAEPYRMIGRVYLSVNTEEYNLIPAMLAAPGIASIGYTLPAFTFFLFLIYQGSFGFVLSGTLLRAADANTLWGKPAIALSVLAVAFVPAMLVPLQVGMVDVVALPLTAILLAATWLEKQRDRHWQTIVAIGLCLFLLPIIRRYFANWMLAWLVAMGIVATVRAFADKDFGWKGWSRTALTLTASTLLAVGLWVAFFLRFLKRSILTDYADLYQAYQRGGWAEDLQVLWLTLGPLQLVLSVGGLIASLWWGGRQRWFGITVFLHLIIVTCAHLRLNNFSPQHYYLITGDVVVLTFLGLAALYRLTALRWIVWVLAAFLSYNTLFAFNGMGNWLPGFITATLSRVHNPPRWREDLAQVQALAQYLADRTGENKKQVYVACAGYELNEDILDHAFFPERISTLPGLARPHSGVDRRDPFPQTILQADYVVVSNPIAYHLLPSDERIVGIFAAGLQDTAWLGKHYRRVAEYTIQGGMHAIVLEKTSGFSAVEMAAVADSIKHYYPEYPAMYTYVPWPGRLASRDLPGQWAMANLKPAERVVELHPADEGPATLGFDLYGECSKLAFATGPWGANPTALSARLTITLDDKTIGTYLFTPGHFEPVNLDVRGGHRLTLSLDRYDGTNAQDGIWLSNFVLE